MSSLLFKQYNNINETDDETFASLTRTEVLLQPKGFGYAQQDSAKEQERSLLSPLLAAVNDITKRDAELQMYFNQNLDKDSLNTNANVLLLPTNSNCVDETATAADQSDNEFECFAIADTPVFCRAKASLPTKYLQFGDVDVGTNELTVLAKKRISRLTKFGPFEGVSTLDLDIHVPRYFPLLMLDETHILDTSNENSSNWMRYVRLANTFAQQNLHLLLERGNLYFRTTRDIGFKEELRVGYHRTYAVRFSLLQLKPTHKEEKDNEKEHAEAYVEPSNESLKNNKNLKSTMKKQHRRYRLRSRLASEILTRSTSRRIAAPADSTWVNTNVSNFITNDQPDNLFVNKKQPTIKSVEEPPKDRTEERRNKLLVKRCRIIKTLKFKCNLCAKSFHTQSNLDHHKTTHPPDMTKPYLCPHCQQQCATPTALVSHIQSHSHSSSGYACIYCNAKFNYVRDFKQHVGLHQSPDATFQCINCKKCFEAYHLVRKHVRMSHNTRTIGCNRCNKRFQDTSNLQRHQLTHTTKKFHACVECARKFRRRDQLRLHMQRKHSMAAAMATLTNKQEGESAALDKLKSPVPLDDKNSEIGLNNGELALPSIELVANRKADAAAHTENVDNLNLMSSAINDGSQYLQLSPIKALQPSKAPSTPTTSSSSSNRRKQIPTKLKAVEEINSEPVTFVALSEMEMPTPFFISENDLHEELKKPDHGDIFCSPRKIFGNSYKMPLKVASTEKNILVDPCDAQNHKAIKNKILENFKAIQNMADPHDKIKNNEIPVLENIKSIQNCVDQDRLHAQSKNSDFKILEENCRNWDVLNHRPQDLHKSNLNETAIYEYIKPSQNLADYFWLDEQDTLDNLKQTQNLQHQSTMDLATMFHENVNHDALSERPPNRNRNHVEISNIEYLKPSQNLADYFWLDDQAQEEIIENGMLENFKQSQPNLVNDLSDQKNDKSVISGNINSSHNFEQQHRTIDNLPNNNASQQSNDVQLNSNNSPSTVAAVVQAEDSLYPQYPFSCHLCGNVCFKRRGILVNHYVKLHPQQNINEVAQLNAPIVKPQLRFPCPYCQQCVYKSNNKRKAHILKHHAEQQALSTESRTRLVVVEGSAEAEIHKCAHCPSQYAARSRLVAHYRKAHCGAILPQPQARLNLGNQQQAYRASDEFSQQPEFSLTPATIAYPPVSISPENKLLKLSSAALELSRWDFLNERIGGTTTTTTDDLNRLPVLFDESTLAEGLDATTTLALDKYKYGSIEAQFFEKIGKL